MPARIDRTRKVENALNSVLIKLNSTIKNDVNFPSNIIELKNRYDNLVYTSIRKAITMSYDEGMDYVAKKSNVDTYPTMTDTLDVKKQTDENVTRFWNIITNDANRELGNQVAEFIANEDKPDFDTEYWLSQIALNSTLGVLNHSIISKANQITDQVNFVNNQPDPNEFPSDGIGDEGDDEDGPKFLFTWVTSADEKVCPICSDLDGQEWYNDDPDLPEPITDTHEDCRCWLEMELLEFDIQRTV